MKTLLWLQRDLRTSDNPVLNWAINRGKPVIAIYIHSPDEDGPCAPGEASSWWLYQSLQKLENKLHQLGIKLYYFAGDTEILIPQLATTLEIDAVCWTNRVEPGRRLCENNIETALHHADIEVKRFRDGLLRDPGQLLTQSKNTPYLVFTPFYRRLRSFLSGPPDSSTTTPVSSQKESKPLDCDGIKNLGELNLLGNIPWFEKFHQYWQPGEDAALDRLSFFNGDLLVKYSEKRDFPALDGTSALSAHLHFGEISAHQILHELFPLIEFGPAQLSGAAEGFLRQLIWREFARYILWHFPETISQPMNKKYQKTFWNSDPEALRKWQRGETGIPIVDAGMKQLWETGSMHNRVRMLVASLLTKNLGLSWQEGAKWFWNTLVDADLANNTMGWQWVAGCGVDAAPYFRIFNPYTQAKRFDPDHVYQKRWLDVDIDSTSFEPIVDVKLSRSDALERYKRLGQNQVNNL